MSDYNEITYGERIADIYDAWYHEFDPATIEILHKIAGKGPALELGIGTGRIALPLTEKGVEVHGIDASPAMVEKLRIKPGGKNIPITTGNFADVAVENRYSLIYVLFNTLFALTTQNEQVRCFKNVAQHLTQSGKFVVEAFVPDLSRFTASQALRVIELDTNQVRLDASQHHASHQLIISQHIVLSENGVKTYPVQLRYIWPSEMDLMAKLAGMYLESRWSNWNEGPFDSNSGRHISIYARETL